MAGNKDNQGWEEVPSAPSGNGGWEEVLPINQLTNPMESQQKASGAGLLKALSYPGGLARAGVGGSINALSDYIKGKEAPLAPLKQDVWEALKGNAPRTEEYLSRAGMDPSIGRKILGFTGDVASDVAGTKGLGALAENVGTSIYNIPFKKANLIAEQTGVAKPGTIFMENNAIPITKEGIAEKAQNLLGKYSKERSGIVSDVANVGQTIPEETALQPAQDLVSKLSSSHSAQERDAAESLQQIIDAQIATGKDPGINQLLQVKSSIGRGMRPKAFQGNLQKPSLETSFEKAMGGGYKSASEQLAESSIPGYGKKLSDVNSKVGSMLSLLPQAERQALVESSKMPVTQMDALLLALDPQLVAAKALGRLSHLPAVPTSIGLGLTRSGQALQKIIPATTTYNAWKRLTEE